MDSLRLHLLNQTDKVCSIQASLVAVPALGPENGGDGEWEKAAFVEQYLQNLGIARITRLDSPDERVGCGLRPNIIATVPGRTAKTLWLFGHLDIVPPGQGWLSDPFSLRREGDLVYGRGVEDNNQAVVSMLILADALVTLGITPDLGLGMVFMADEECGSCHGLGHILRQAPQLFSPDDYYVVPDGGFPDAASIEVAEKAQLWLKFTIRGRQCHASAPQHGVNALVGASKLICQLAELNFPQRDDLFAPPVSTVVPTKHDQNVDAVNILPGTDIFYVDCRLLPLLNPNAVLAQVRTIAENVAADLGMTIDLAVVQNQAATRTDPKSAVVVALQEAIKAVYGVQAKPCGIGGATVAALLREAGLPAAVWACIRNTCHQPNECASLSATCKDAAVFAHMLMEAC